MNIKGILPAIFFGLALVVWTFFAWPIYQGYSELGTQINLVEERIENRHQHFASVQQLASSLEQDAEELRRLEIALPDHLDEPFLLYSFNQNVSQEGLFLENIGVIERTGPRGLTEFSINLQLAGSYENLKGYLDQLRNSASVYDVQTVQIAPPDGNQQEQRFRFGVSLNTYSR